MGEKEKDLLCLICYPFFLSSTVSTGLKTLSIRSYEASKRNIYYIECLVEIEGGRKRVSGEKFCSCKTCNT
jgi:hypothetical protein